YDLDKVGLYDIEEDRKRLEKTGLIAAEERGERRGLKQGKMETARILLKDNIPIAKVVQYTGLSEKQVRNLC
ncbi:MAG TPA: hypothetical protein IAB45_00335, partial [Candidatus Onthousia faecavium]|nr:hypothetical protein [Candidatus Onthousia faecavium]